MGEDLRKLKEHCHINCNVLLSIIILHQLFIYISDASPWQTWISCEEVMGGQCWQIDPHPLSLRPARVTLLGDSVQGGKYESVAVDNRNPERPIFFTTEDHEWGALRRFRADRRGWHALHTGGNTTLLNILDESTFEWTTDEGKGRTSANTYFR